MSWIAVDTGLGNHAKMAELPSDAARWGWLLTLCEAKEQRKPGTFASERHYRHVLARHGRFLPTYIKAGLIDKDEDGTLHVHDWQRHQWAAAKAVQRETTLGHSEDIPKTSLGQKEDASRAVPVPVYVGSTEEGVQGEEPDAAVTFRDRTGTFPAGKILSWVNELSANHGERNVVSVLAETPFNGNVVDYLRTVRDVLRAADHKANRAEKADEARRLEEKRAPLRALPPATDISEAEAKRLAAEYMAEVRR